MSHHRHPSTSKAVVDASLTPIQPLAAPASLADNAILEGWLLKKRRKKMQGFARRYFTLHQSGLLTYSFHPSQPPRDHILLTQAAITTASGRKDIHIDSNNATFHIKCLSTEDFNKWMTAFRLYITSPETATVGRKSSISRSISRQGYYNRSGALVDEIGTSIGELQGALATLLEEDARRRQEVAKQRADRDLPKEHSKDYSGHVRSLFKNKKAQAHEPVHDPPAEDAHIDHAALNTPSPSLQRMQTVLQSLKYQHTALVQSLYATADSGHAHRASPLLATAREEEEIHTPVSSHSTIGRHSNRFSIQSESSVWYDAAEFDGAEEFLIDDSPGDDSRNSNPSEILSPSLSTSTSTSAQESAESDSESDSSDCQQPAVEPEQPQLESATSIVSEMQAIVRRTQLPSPPVGDEGSLFTVLKKNVGKDLTQVALPVTFNEPLTLLQRLAEEIEYFDLISNAVQSQDPVERLSYVAAFAVSGYANTKHRTGRKGFNPMLAETFEDPRMRFIAEKVCHNPVILAYHAEGNGWELYATSGGKTKFWGKSLEIIPQGSTHLVIGEDHFEWTKPSSFMRNLMMGTKYLEHCGKMVIHNKTTGARCVLEFKESGYWGVSNQVAGTVLSPEGRTVSHLEGKWDEQLVQKLDASHLRILWRMSHFPRNAPEYYGFTSFGITLNEITPDLEGRLPPTDSRFRPDVRALEEGELDLAEEEKARVEEMQRERRRQGRECKPRWFKKVGEEWEYAGGYWEQRKQGWQGLEPLW